LGDPQRGAFFTLPASAAFLPAAGTGHLPQDLKNAEGRAFQGRLNPLQLPADIAAVFTVQNLIEGAILFLLVWLSSPG